MREALEGEGAEPEFIEAHIEAAIERATYEVHADNKQLVDAFLRLQTQWRVVVGGLGRPVYQGIDYGSIPAVLRMIGIPRRELDEAFGWLQVMEAAALPALNTPREDGDV